MRYIKGKSKYPTSNRDNAISIFYTLSSFCEKYKN